MQIFLNRVLPFCLALFVGVALTSVVSHKTPRIRNWKTCHRRWASRHVVSQSPLKIESVPDIEFSDAVKKPTNGSVRLIALFGADGSVKAVRPFPMLPHGVPESEAGQVPYVGYTPMMRDGQFVRQLPFGLMESAIEQVRGIRFRPRLVEGQPVSEWVQVNTEFDYSDSQTSAGCNSIRVTVMDDRCTLWHGDTWIQRNHRACSEI